ncbi:restriction endonuclease subunit S [Nocardia asteroides]|uniref:restriction endonuclease subunit S n=1 Tax=Nocardia asteroides TaxID=1824 RepID=UPI00341A7277
MIATNCLKAGSREIVFENLRYVDEETYSTWFRSHPEPGDVLFVCKGSPGRVAIVPDPVSFCIAQDMVALRAASDVWPGYLYYRIMAPDVQFGIQNMHVGTMIPHFKKGDFGNLSIRIHRDTSEQRAIAEVLGALDDKIAANNRILRIMDELIRAMYMNLPESTMTIGDIAAPARSQISPNELQAGTKYLGLEHLPRRSIWATEHGNSQDVSSAKSQFSRGDILFGKLRPYFHKVVSAGFSGICSTDIIVLRAKESRLAGLTLAAASSDDAVRACTAASEGTRMPRTSWKDLSAVPVRCPDLGSADEFNDSVIQKSDFAHALVEELGTLAKTRDELLPLLMSGKLRVKDAEKKVEAIA